MAKQYSYKQAAEAYRHKAKKLPFLLGIRMRVIGKEIADDAKDILKDNGNIDTGALYNSIRSDVKEKDREHLELDIIADAKSEEGTYYAEFIEYGTGAYNEQGTGRQTPWRYQDRNGVWHTTSGYEAHPYIRPAVEKNRAALNKALKKAVMIDGEHQNSSH